MKTTGYKIRVVSNTKTSCSYALGLPSEMAKQVPKTVTFHPEWHPDGILFKAASVVTGPIPAWAREKS